MIFKNLFAPKWKSAKVSERLQAVAQLDLEKQKNKDVLITLATSDDTVDVRKSALTKLNDISLWWKAYKGEQNSQLQDTAEKKVFNAILANDNSIDAEQVASFIASCKKASQLEQLLPFCKSNEQLVSSLKRIAKPALIEKHFANADETLQRDLMPLVEQFKLEQSIIKTAKGAIKVELDEKAKQAELQKVRPAQVEQQTKMVLAQLNALRDKFDYQVVSGKLAQYQAQWQDVELQWLADELKQTVEDKYTSLLDKLNTHVAKLKDEFDKVQAEIAAAAAFDSQLEKVKQQSDALKAKLSNALGAPTDALLTELSNDKELLVNELAKLDVKRKATGEITQHVNKLVSQVEQLPELKQSIEQVAAVFNRFESVVKVESKDVFDQAKVEFDAWYKDAKNALTDLPKTISGQYHAQLKELANTWHSDAKEVKDQLQSNFKHCQSKLRDIKRLIEAGRYKVCFGIFKNVEEKYTELTDGFKANLQADYDLVKQKLDDVNEWQREISLPKRHEMIAEVTALTTEENVDVTKRSDAIKLLRKRWNELGYLQTDEEKALDKSFNELLETAFTPCREFYAAREKQREENIAKRKTIIEQTNSLSEQLSDENVADIEKSHNKLKKAWREAGEVDGKNYKTLLQELKVAERPIVDFVKQNHKNNAEQKQQLVTKATKLVEFDDVFAACEQLKQLQQDWKQIGFAGHKTENKLWASFRESNDAIFAKRDEQQAQREAQNAERVAEFNGQYESILAQYESVNTPSQAQAAVDALTDFTQVMEEQEFFDKALNHKVNKKIEAMTKTLSELLNSAQSKVYVALFDAFESGDDLPANWQQQESDELSRAQLTVRLEIAADAETPDSDKALRMSEQVELLQAKMRGEQLDKDALLKAWVNKGPLLEDEAPLLQRVKDLFC